MDIESPAEYPSTVSFCCYENAENISGDNIIYEEPLMIHTAGESSTWDLHLQAGSPCIDIGALTDAPATDLDGTSRPQGAGIDMGAYEFSQELIASFYSDKNAGGDGLSVNFYDASIGNPDSWAWDFQGDGMIDSNEKNPHFTYQNPGCYTVSLTVSKGALEDSEAKIGYIYVGKRIYVSPDGDDVNNGQSWAFAYKTIKKAVNTATSYDEVWVAAALYQEGEQITVPLNVTLYGGFAGTEVELAERDIENNPTIIDGNNTHQCVKNYGILDGYHVANGYSEYHGGGISNLSGIVKNCKIYGNTTYGKGGGIYNVLGKVLNCSIYGNHATNLYGGGIHNDRGSVTNCSIYENTAVYGGSGIYNNAFLSNCMVHGNISTKGEGGICNAGFVTHCRIYENRSTVIGGIVNSGSLINSIIYDNHSFQDAGGISNTGKVINCTVCGNTSKEGSGGIYNYLRNDDQTSTGLIENCIVWGNSPQDIICFDIPDVSVEAGTVAFSCYEKGIGIVGNDNIQQDPLFVNVSGESATWDLHLLSGSPCLDSGTSVDAPETDIEGNARPQGTGFEMGAYEGFVLQTNVESSLWSLMK